jgi:hypothetical protein
MKLNLKDGIESDPYTRNDLDKPCMPWYIGVCIDCSAHYGNYVHPWKS